MTKKHPQVIWVDPAAISLRRILRHISRSSPMTAKKLLIAIKALAKTLEAHPLKGRIVPELSALGFDKYRELIYHPWRLIYEISPEQDLHILAMIDSRRNVEEVLAKQLVNDLIH